MRHGTEEPNDLVRALRELVPHTVAVVVLPWPDRAPDAATTYRWQAVEAPEATAERLAEVVSARMEREGPFGFMRGLGTDEELTAWAEPILAESGRAVGALCVARRGNTEWTDEQGTAMRVFASMWRSSWTKSSPEYRRRLDELVVNVARRLMRTDVATLQETLDWTVETLARFLAADVAFLRRNDHAAGVSILVADYPPRTEIPDPDPLAVVPFDADPIFGALKDLKQPLATQRSLLDEEGEAYVKRLEAGTGFDSFSGAAVPLLNGEVTEGALGFLRFRDVQWTTPEINALEAVAAMLVQLNARVEAESRLVYQALHDDLTGLANRRALLNEIDERLRNGTKRIALLFIDLDRFKFMNDYLGHIAGDRVLVTIADRLRTSVRPSDFVARLGGDEFVVVMDAAEGELGATATANRLLALVEEPVEVNGQYVTHTASIGIALGEPRQMSGVELLGHADVALYAAKTQGKNRAIIFDDVLRLEVDERSDTELMLREALEHGGLRLFYQPEFDLTNGRMLGVEALVRCESPVRGLIPANQFIGVAEESGLIVDLGRWVLEEACRQMAAWRERYPARDLVVRVNMSPAQLASPGIVEHVSSALRRAGLPGSALCLEITEHAVMRDIDRALKILEKFRALGVRLALDDFGTGFSSMGQLKRLPIHALKIDTSFVIGVARDPADQAIVQSLVNLGKAFGLDVVAEGVESQEDMDELIHLGCTRAQGFLLAKPQPAASLERMLWRGGIDLARI